MGEAGGGGFNPFLAANAAPSNPMGLPNFPPSLLFPPPPPPHAEASHSASVGATPAAAATNDRGDSTNTRNSPTLGLPSGNGGALYAPQMSILREMGFEDEELCLRALEATNGDVEDALTYIDEHQAN
ncbi:unnamed protein product, partial [Phytomonas sp. EM1]